MLLFIKVKILSLFISWSVYDLHNQDQKLIIICFIIKKMNKIILRCEVSYQLKTFKASLDVILLTAADMDVDCILLFLLILVLSLNLSLYQLLIMILSLLVRKLLILKVLEIYCMILWGDCPYPVKVKIRLVFGIIKVIPEETLDRIEKSGGSFGFLKSLSILKDFIKYAYKGIIYHE